MTTLAEFMIIAGADNRPPMLEKSMYDSWKSCLAVPVLTQADGPISFPNKAMAFLSAVAASRPRNAAWFKDKAMLAEAQEPGQILDEEQLAFLADPSIPDDACDSDCDDVFNAKAVLMANLSNYGSDVILEVPHSESYQNAMDNQSVDAMQDFEQTPVVDFLDNEITTLGYQNPFYLKKSQRIKLTLYDGSVISSQHAAILVIDDEETLNLEEVRRSKMLAKENDPISKEKKINNSPINYVELNQLSGDFGKCFVPKQELSVEQDFWLQTSHPNTDQSDISPVKIEAPRKLLKVSLVNTSLKKLKYHLGKFDIVVKKRITPDAITEGEWGFEHTKAIFLNEIIPFLKTLKDIFNVFDKDLLNEVTEVQTVFNQMEAAVQQYVMLCVINSIVIFGDSINLVMKKSKSCNKCLDLEAELVKKKNMVERDVYSKISNRFATLEKHCISLELDIQLNQQIFQKYKSCENQNAPGFLEFFENNDLKAQLQEKDTTINKLRNHIKSLRKTDKKDRVKQDMDEIETINIELEHSVAKLLSENKLLHKEIEHLKKIYKDQFDSIIKTRALSKEHYDSLIAQLNSKSMENADLKGQIQEGCQDCSPIMGYGDYQLGNITISRVYYVEGINHNLFLVEQFCDSDLEVTFWKNTWFVQDLDGVELLLGSKDTNLYIISLRDMLNTSPICLLSKDSKTKSWLWHRWLSHLNFSTLNQLAKDGLA
ncbi:retrovirus-related pol polyprotein from transposon TNT 1-94 [Tanacetum coccineum]